MAGFWWFLWTQRAMWNICCLALSSQKWLKTHQDSTRPYASPVGVVEDRSVLMGGFWWFQWTHRVMENISYLALSSQKWL